MLSRVNVKMDGELSESVCLAVVFVALEAYLRTAPRRRAVRFVQMANELLDTGSGITPIGADLVTVSTQRAAADLWRAKLSAIVSRLR